MAKKVLITGCCGLIGRELVSQLSSLGYDITGVDDHSRSSLFMSGHKFYDLSVVEYLEKTEEIFDTVFHLAAVNGTTNFYDKPNQVLSKNIETDLAVFKFVEKHPSTKLIYASSSEIVAGTDQFPTPEIDSIEIKNIHNPRWSYRLSKIVSENYLFNSNIDFLIIRFFNVFSEHSNSGHFVKDLVNNIRLNNFTLIGADETRSFCYVSDAIDALIKVYDKVDREIINIGSSEEIKIREASTIISNSLGIKNIVWNELPSRTGSVSRRCPDISRLLRLYPEFNPKKFSEVIEEIKSLL